MNYTENYHLPQWEKADRVLMEDFNSAMADIESGFGRLDQAGGERMFQRLCRAAYNHYSLLRTFDPFPWQDGVFHQDSGSSDEGISGMVKFDGCFRLSYCQAVDKDALFRTFRQSRGLQVNGTGSALPLEFSFTAPCNAYMQAFGIYLTHTNCSNTRVPCTVQCYDNTAGKNVRNGECSLYVASNNGAYPLSVTVNMNLHQGHQYSIVLTPTPTAGAYCTAKIDSTHMSVETYTTGGEGSVSHSFRDLDKNMGVMVAARFTTPADLPRLFWNGTEVPAHLIWTQEDGQEFQEAVFLRQGEVEAGDTMKLVFTCPQNQEVCFYDWGAALI